MEKSNVTENIKHLIGVWEELANEPEELVLFKTFYHDLLIMEDRVEIAIISGDIRKHLKKDISALNEFISKQDIEISFMKSYYSSHIMDLQQATTEIDGVRYDLEGIQKAVRGIIAEIRNPNYLKNVCQEIGRICITDTSETREKITNLVHILLVRLIEQASDKMLKEHVGNVVNRTFLEMHSTEIAAALQQQSVADAFMTLLESLSFAFKLFVQDFIRPGDVPVQEKIINIVKHFLESDRDASMRIRIFFLRRMFEGVIVPDTIVRDIIDALARNTQEQENLIENYAIDPFWLNIGEQWFQEFAEEAILYYVRSFLDVSSPNQLNKANREKVILNYQQKIPHIHTLWQKYSEDIAESLLNTGLFSDFETDLPSLLGFKGELVQEHSAKQALNRIIDYQIPFNLALEMGRLCSVNISPEQKRYMIQKMVQFVIREIFMIMKESIDKGNIDVIQLGGFDLGEVINRFKVQGHIIEQLRQWLELITECFITSSYLLDDQKDDVFLVGDIKNVEVVYHQRIARRIIENFGSSYTAHIVENIQIFEVEAIISALPNRFISPQKQYQVTGIVDGLDLQGKTVRIGEVQLYDSRIWDYGEGNLLDTFHPAAYRGVAEQYAPLASDDLMRIFDASVEYNGFYGSTSNQFVRHSARATVTIAGNDPKMAQQRAQIEIQQVLDVLTWSQTKPKERDRGSKFELLPYYAVVTSDHQSTETIADDASPKLIALKVEGNSFEQIIQAYHKLLAIPPMSQKPVEAATLRALHWLGRGYWEKYPPDRFINYWIAVEQLIVQPGQSKLVGVKSRLPDLVATWYQNDEGQKVLRAWQALLREIKNNPDVKERIDRSSTFIDWNINADVILRNLSKLEQIDVNQALTSIESLKVSMDNAKIANIQIEEQEKLRYKIDLLNSRRNRIVHEGFSYSTDMYYFTSALWDIAYQAVNCVLDRIVEKPGHYQSVDDVIREYEIPF